MRTDADGYADGYLAGENDSLPRDDGSDVDEEGLRRYQDLSEEKK